MRWLAPLIALALTGCDVSAADITGSAAPSGSPTTNPIPDVMPDLAPGVLLQEFPSGGPRNEVHLLNQQDGRFMARASIKLFKVDSDSVKAMNIAIAEGRCTDCQTIAFALQVVLYKRGASDVQPVNVAISENVGCTRCITLARAIQYAIPVDDPNKVPDDVRALLRDMQRELQYFSTVKSLSELDPDEASRRIDAVIAQYAELQQFLTQLQDAKRTDGPSPSPSTSPTGSPGASPATSPSPALSPTAAPAPSPTGP